MENPKQKAQNLIRRIYNEPTEHMQWDEAKDVVKIMVDEIIDDYKSINTGRAAVGAVLSNKISFWTEVKNHIENL